MTLKEALRRLEKLGDEKVRAQNRRNGVGDNQFGVRLGDIRAFAAEIKANHELALALWGTENIDARLLAILISKPKDLSSVALDGVVPARLRRCGNCVWAQRKSGERAIEASAVPVVARCGNVVLLNQAVSLHSAVALHMCRPITTPRTVS